MEDVISFGTNGPGSGGDHPRSPFGSGVPSRTGVRRPVARRPPSRRPNRGLVRELIGLAVVVTLIGMVVIVLCRALSYEPGPMMVAVGLTPWLVVVGVVVGILAALLRRSGLAAGAFALVLFVVATVVPSYANDGGSDQTPLMRVAALNLKFGRADTGAVMAMVRTQRIDVLVLTELTGEAETQLRTAGLETVLPGHFSATSPGYPGTGIWSKYPLRNTRRLEGYRSPALVGVVDAAQAGQLTIVAVHPAQPRLWSHGQWSEEHAKLRRDLAAVTGERVVVAGDFNATLDHAPMRRLAKDGYLDAAAHAGSGLDLTWPMGTLSPVPVFAVDHVLTKGDVAGLDTTTVKIPGTDHKAVVVELGRSAWLS